MCESVILGCGFGGRGACQSSLLSNMGWNEKLGEDQPFKWTQLCGCCTNREPTTYVGFSVADRVSAP